MEQLTLSERRVLSLLIDGQTTADIALELGLGLAAVEEHVERAFAKLGGETHRGAHWRRGTALALVAGQVRSGAAAAG